MTPAISETPAPTSAYLRVIDVIQENRKNAGLPPLTQCDGGCGRLTDRVTCGECRRLWESAE